jgi:hypothetical protein
MRVERRAITGQFLHIVVDRVDKLVRLPSCRTSGSAEPLELDHIRFDDFSPRKLSALPFLLLMIGFRSRPVLCLGHAAIETRPRHESNYQS